MKKSLFIALTLLVLPFSLVISSGTANAAVETEKSLNGRLLTTNELKAALDANKVSLNITETAEIPDIKFPELVSTGRAWLIKDGSILYDTLLSYSDGRSIPASRREEVLSGNLAKDFMSTFFDKSEYLGALDVVSENDVLHGFNCKKDGVDYQVAAISFIRGNIFGLIFYATADNQLDEVHSAFGGQLAKLPD